MLIPSKYVLEAGKDAPENTQVCKCRFCGREFAVPNDEIKGQKLSDMCDQDSCKEAHDKEVAVQVQALMKSEASDEGQKEIDNALGK